MSELDWYYDLRNREVLKYYKEQYGYVSGSYAKKVLGVGDVAFKKIKEHYHLQEHVVRAPTVSWDMKLYDLKEIRKIKEEKGKNK